jgi:hypothetical protein
MLYLSLFINCKNKAKGNKMKENKPTYFVLWMSFRERDRNKER